MRIAAFAVVLSLLLSACDQAAPPAAAVAQPAAVAKAAAPPTDVIEHGRVLALQGGCHDCHTPKKFSEHGMTFDMSRAMAGHNANEKLPRLPPEGVIGMEGWGAIGNHHFTAWYGPWGTSFAANLTPHATGIGSWKAEDFIQALRTGKHAGVGRPILPPMPWENYQDASEEDLRALFAYFTSLPPIDNKVPEPIPPPLPPGAEG